MRGTGSTDYEVQDLFVPDRMTAPVGPLRRPAPGFEGPLVPHVAVDLHHG